MNSLKNNNKDLIKKIKELENIINQNNQIMEHVKKINPLIIYIEPTLIGLNNIGATCFMNSI
jgi:ubiquitin C-terminal hydrolase